MTIGTFQAFWCIFSWIEIEAFASISMCSDREGPCVADFSLCASSVRRCQPRKRETAAVRRTHWYDIAVNSGPLTSRDIKGICFLRCFFATIILGQLRGRGLAAIFANFVKFFPCFSILTVKIYFSGLVGTSPRSSRVVCSFFVPCIELWPD